MSEMVERVARAVFELQVAPDNAVERALQMPICRTIAIAAIAAMREPTEEMKVALQAELRKLGSTSTHIYVAAIDAALNH